MKKHTVLKAVIALLSLLVLAAMAQSYLVGGKQRIKEEDKHKTIEQAAGTQQAAAAAKDPKTRIQNELDDGTRVDAWEVQCKQIISLSEKQVTGNDAQLTLFNYSKPDADGKRSRTELRATSKRVEINDKQGTLSGGVELRSEDGTELLLDSAVVDLERKWIQSPGAVTLRRIDLATGGVLLSIKGQRLSGDSKLEVLQLETVDEIIVHNLPGDTGMGGDLTGSSDGPLSIDTTRGVIDLPKPVRMHGSAGALTADALNIQLSPQEQTVDTVTATGHVQLRYLQEDRKDAQPWLGHCELLVWRAQVDLQTLEPSLPAERDAALALANPGSDAAVELRCGKQSLAAKRLILRPAAQTVYAFGDPVLQGARVAQAADGSPVETIFTARAAQMTATYLDQPDHDTRYQLKEARLTGGVSLTDGAATLAGDELIWNELEGTSILSGSPATLTHERANIEAATLALDRGKYTVRVDKASRMEFTLPAKVREDGTELPASHWSVQADAVLLTYDEQFTDVQAVSAAGAVAARSELYAVSADTVDLDAQAESMALKGAPARVELLETGEHAQASTLVVDRKNRGITAEKNVELLVKRALPTAQDNAPGEYTVRADSAEAELDEPAESITRFTLRGHVEISGSGLSGNCAELSAHVDASYFKAVAGENDVVTLSLDGDQLSAGSIEKTEAGLIQARTRVTIIARDRNAGALDKDATPWAAEADEMDVHIDEANRALLKLTARNHVILSKDGITGSGDQLTWMEDSQFAILTGTPARIVRASDELLAEKVFYARKDRTISGQGDVAVTLSNLKDLSADMPADTQGRLRGQSFKVTLEEAATDVKQSSIRSAVVEGDLRFESEGLSVRGSRFEWDGGAQKGILTGNERIEVRQHDNWITAQAAVFRPQRKPGQENFITFIGPIKAAKQGEKDK